MDGESDVSRPRGPFSGTFHSHPATQTAGRAATYRPQNRSEGIHLGRGQIHHLGEEKTNRTDPSLETGFGQTLRKDTKQKN